MDLMRGSMAQFGQDQLDAQLEILFRAYRNVCLAPEPGQNFMPELWQRIESRQVVTFSFRRMANAMVTAAMAASVALGVYMAMPHGASANPSYYSSYVEALSAANTPETPDIVPPIKLDLTEP